MMSTPRASPDLQSNLHFISNFFAFVWLCLFFLFWILLSLIICIGDLSFFLPCSLLIRYFRRKFLNEVGDINPPTTATFSKVFCYIWRNNKSHHSHIYHAGCKRMRLRPSTPVWCNGESFFNEIKLKLIKMKNDLTPR